MNAKRLFLSAVSVFLAGCGATAYLSAATAEYAIVSSPEASDSSGQRRQLAQVAGTERTNWLTRALKGAEWRDRFDSSGRHRTFEKAESSPLLGTHAVPAIMAAIDTYSRIAATGGWNSVPKGPTMRIGSRHRNIAHLRRRLIVTGDLEPQHAEGTIFDSYVQDAVRGFQARHGIVPSGTVRADTLAALNVPVEVRIRQLRNNLDRFSAMVEDPGDRYIAVNIPGAEIEAVEAGFVVSRHTAIVGKIDRQTPLLSSSVYEINFNPYWTVPKSIIRKDVIPTVRKDPSYLKRYNIRILDNAGNEIDPLVVNWSTDEAVDYMFRQDPGEINSLGTVKINFHNTHQVYLHDTPSKGLFARNFRFHSSGCVRVQNVRELVTWILRDTDNWSRSRTDSIIRTGERLDISVKNRVKVHFLYFTAWANTNGAVHFRDDVYKADLYAQSAAAVR